MFSSVQRLSSSSTSLLEEEWHAYQSRGRGEQIPGFVGAVGDSEGLELGFT